MSRDLFVFGHGYVAEDTYPVAAGAAAAPALGGAASCGTASQCSFTLNANATVTGTFHALTSIAVAPSTATRAVGETKIFIANGTFSNGVTEQIPFGNMGTWRTKTAMPATKFAFGVTALNGLLYAIGGGDSGAPGAPGPIVRVYDPVANTWSTAASMPTGREGLGVVTVNGLIYAIGGNTVGSVPVATVERYDPSTNTWISRAPLSGARRYLAAGVVNGIIYAVGGETVSGGVSTTVATVEAYDPATNVWTTKTPMLTARSFHGVGVVNGILYAVGGDTLGTVEAYDPSTNTWTAKASQPTGGNGALAVAVADDVLYAIGGSAAGSATVQYDVARDAWSIKTGMPTSRSELAAVAINGTIYAVGGLAVPNPGPGTNLPLATVEAFTDHLRWSSSAPAVVRVTQQGLATAASVGSANIIASVGSLTCGTTCGALAVSVTDAVMSLDKSSLQFGATSNGSAFVQQTGSQIVRLTQSGCCTVTWTATPAQPWITVSPTSGTGTTTVTIGVTHVSSLPASGGVNGLVNFAFTGATNSSAAIGAALNIVPSGTSGAPAGTFETPLDNATGVSGSIAVTGWAVDDVEVTRVRILREPVAGETAGQLVFIGDAVFVDGARPDVAAAFPTWPRNTRAGWGYLLLTNFLPNQGNGPFRLHAYAEDADGHSTLLGSKTIACDNAGATRPFGAIDTPAQGKRSAGRSITSAGCSPGARAARIRPAAARSSR